MINLKVADDENTIREFMIEDDVWDTFTDDNSSKDAYLPVFESKTLWLKVLYNEHVIGFIFIENDNMSTLKIHPCLAKEYRPLIRDVFKALFMWFVALPELVNKMVVSIPFTRQIVYNTARKIGFIDEGINRESFLKGGVFHDQWNLGLTRKEIKDLL